MTVVGAGLAGCEAAWALARAGVPVRLVEMRPATMTPAHQTGNLAELVCSNSFRGAKRTQGPGLLKLEMAALDSLIMAAGRAAQVPAGDAMAVDRDILSREVAARLAAQPLVTIVRERVDAIPEGPAILATGPLTHGELAAAIAHRVGRGALAFYDAIAPIVSRESVDFEQAWVQDRWGEPGSGAYVNCPLDRADYEAFVARLRAGPYVPYQDFETDLRHFEGCLPIEEMAARGVDTLRYGPMKPVGLTDPRSGRRPWAVVQLRPDNRSNTLMNLVGFQTKMTYGAQQEALRMIPALRDAEFVRLGSLHRNTFLDSPRLLAADLSLRGEPRLRFAGQVTGVEGYVESAACGIVAGLATAAMMLGRPFVPPPPTTAIGALLHYISDPAVDPFQPMNINFGLLAALPNPPRNKGAKRDALADRASADLQAWIGTLDGLRVAA